MFDFTRNAPKSPAQVRDQKLFYVSLVGAGLCVIAPYLDWATVSVTGYGSQTAQGNDKGGVGYWPLLFALLAAGLLFLASRSATLPPRALQIAAGCFGLWIVIYDWMRWSDDQDQISKAENRTGLDYSLDAKIGFYVLIIAGLMLAGVAFMMVYLGLQDTRRLVGATGMPYGGQPYGGQPYGGQPYGGQPYAGPPYGGQPYNGEPYGGQPPPAPGYPQAQPPPQGFPVPPPVLPPYGAPPVPQGPPPNAGPPPAYPPQQPQPPLPPASPTYGGRR